MRSAVRRDELKAVIGFGQHHDKHRRLHNLTDRADVEEAHVQSAERGWHAIE